MRIHIVFPSVFIFIYFTSWRKCLGFSKLTNEQRWNATILSMSTNTCLTSCDQLFSTFRVIPNKHINEENFHISGVIYKDDRPNRFWRSRTARRIQTNHKLFIKHEIVNEFPIVNMMNTLTVSYWSNWCLQDWFMKIKKMLTMILHKLSISRSTYYCLKRSRGMITDNLPVTQVFAKVHCHW